MKKRELNKAVKRVNLYVKKGKEVYAYYRTSIKRFYPLVRARKGEEYAVKVTYSDGNVNESTWYKTKKELIHAYKCFTERELLKEFIN